MDFKERIERIVREKFNKEVSEMFDETFDKYWFLIHDLLSERKCRCVLKNDEEKECEKCLEYIERSEWVAREIINFFMKVNKIKQK